MVAGVLDTCIYGYSICTSNYHRLLWSILAMPKRSTPLSLACIETSLRRFEEKDVVYLSSTAPQSETINRRLVPLISSLNAVNHAERLSLVYSNYT